MLLFVFIFTIILSGNLMSQDFDFANRLYFDYENFKEGSITHRRFKHSDILPLIKKLEDKKIFKVSKAGTSAEGRDIFLISAGTGKKKVFLWSQMHGDEPTATMAIMDIFNFLADHHGYENIVDEMLESLTLYFMPMVNPDGAERYKRRNIFDIDINRDAVRNQTPEGKILKDTFDSLKADFGFNLHDQSPRYSAGNSPKSAAVSFLAPAFNYEKDFDSVRTNAVKVIGIMNNVLAEFMPGHIAKYSDDFEPRAFGDNFQKWGTSTILIESGGWKGDPEKQFLRKMNFISLLSAFKSIAEDSYKNIEEEVYNSIPFNEKYIMDLVLRGLKINHGKNSYIADIGINRYESDYDNASKFYYRSSVEDIGDLSIYYGYDELDLTGYELKMGKIKPESFSSIDEINKLNFIELYKSGYTGVKLNTDVINKQKFTEFPLNIYLNDSGNDEKLDLGEVPNYIIEKKGKVKFAVINGFIFDLETNSSNIKNGLIIR